MADKFDEIFEKVEKQLFIAGAKKVFPSVMAPIAGVLGDEGFGYLKKKVKENDFQKEYEETINRLYPGKYELINTYVERITEKNDLWQTLLDDEFDFEKVANTLIKQFLSPQEVRDLDDPDVAGIKIGLIIMIERSYETLCSLEDEDVKKWLVEQTAKNGHSIEKQDIKIEELRLFFNQQAATIETALKLILVEAKRNDKQDSRLDNHEARLGKVEKGTPKGIPDRAETFKARWNRHLFLEEDKENQEDKKKLSDVYIIPQVQGHLSEPPQSLDEFLKENPYEFTLFLGQPGVGKSTLISAYLNGVFGSCDVPCSVFKFSDFAGRDFWGKPAADAADALLLEIGIHTSMDLNNRTIFLDGFDEISMGRTARVQFLIALRNWLNDEDVRNCRIFVTCRTNYMEEAELKKAEMLPVEIQPFSEEQIGRFCRTYRKGIQNRTIKKLQGRKDLYGFPVLLYIVLVTRVYEENAKNEVEIYKELFSRLYKRSWDSQNRANGHAFTTTYETFYNRLAQRIAVYMFEHGDEAEGCPIEEIKKIGKALVKEYPDEFKDIPENTPALIGGFYKSHLLENDQVKDFVHRTIYEYFFTGYLAETVKEHLSDENSDWFVQKFCRAMQYRELSNEMRHGFIDHTGVQKEEIVLKIKKEFEKALDREQLSKEPKYLRRIVYEQYVMSNCLSIIKQNYCGNGKWKVNSNNLVRYLRAVSSVEEEITINLSNYDLSNANLQRVNLSWAILENTDLRETLLNGANLSQAILSGADLSQAILSDANLTEADLNGTNFFYSKLEGADLRESDLSHACLVMANLAQAQFNNANLREANLNDAELYCANLFGVILEDAQLSGAHLEGANLRGANLTATDFGGAFIDKDTKFPEGFDIKGKGMKLVMPDGRIKDIDSDKIIQDISADEQDSEEEPQ